MTKAAAQADLAIVALPDQAQPAAWGRWIEDALPRGAVVGFVHGFAIRFGFIAPREDLGVVLVAPKGPGATLRARFEEGRGIPALVAVERENAAGEARSLALAWAAGIGCARSGLIETTFAAEAESDLFGEQAVLCGGLLALVHEAYALLVEAGYPPEVAYIECCHEVKQVADLLYARGPDGMRRAISDTAEFGAFVLDRCHAERHAGRAQHGDEQAESVALAAQHGFRGTRARAIAHLALAVRVQCERPCRVTLDARQQLGGPPLDLRRGARRPQQPPVRLARGHGHGAVLAPGHDRHQFLGGRRGAFVWKPRDVQLAEHEGPAAAVQFQFLVGCFEPTLTQFAGRARAEHQHQLGHHVRLVTRPEQEVRGLQRIG
ncbi:MAG: ketol-acid reductoisomerase, partial [Phycisphaerales bacterium]